MAKKKQSPKTVTAIQIAAYTYANMDMPHKEIAKLLNRSDKTILNYLNRVKDFLHSQAGSMMALFKIDTTLIEKSTEAVEYILDDRTPELAELRWKIIKRIFVNSGVLKPEKVITENGGVPAPSVLIDQRKIVSAYNVDIKVNPKPNEDFANGAPGQLERIIRAVKQLGPGQGDDISGEPEETGN